MSLIIFVDKLHLDSDDFTRFNLLGVCWCVWPTAIPSSSATRSSLGHPHSQTTWLGWGLHHRQPRRKHVTQTWARRVAPTNWPQWLLQRWTHGWSRANRSGTNRTYVMAYYAEAGSKMAAFQRYGETQGTKKPSSGTRTQLWRTPR